MLDIAIAATFVWLGMVLAISFLEAPLKFRAPGVTIPLGLGIGRLVFKALNACEVVLAVVVVLALVTEDLSAVGTVAGLVAVVLLAAQVLAVRPALSRRTDAVLASPEAVDGPGSHAHLWYVGLEVLKVVTLVIFGVVVLGA